MTPEEAIEILEEVKELDDTMYAYNPTYMNSLDMAIEALKEVQQYREIGTVEECRKAVEKRRSKKPVLRNDNGKLRKSCPVCGCFFSPLSRSCPKCGQAIDENLEGMEDE